MTTKQNPIEADPTAGETAQRLEALVHESEKLKAAMTRARWIRAVLAVALVLLVGITATSFINLGRRVGSEQNLARMTEIAGKKWESRAPEYRQEIQGVIERATPVLTEAMVAQLKTDMPKLVQAATTERDALAAGFAKGLEERVRGRYHELLEGHQSIIRKEFPEVQDEKLREQLLANFTLAVDRLVEHYYVPKIEQTLTELIHNWDEFPAAEPPKAGEEPVQDQLFGKFAELVALRLSTTDHSETVAR